MRWQAGVIPLLLLLLVLRPFCRYVFLLGGRTDERALILIGIFRADRSLEKTPYAAGKSMSLGAVLNSGL